MQITNISGKNVKGRTFSYDLSPVTMFVGGNATGKTAVMVAIELALRPKISPGNYPAISPLFEGFPDMSMEATTDRGAFFRSFSRSGESIKMNSDGRPDGAIIPPVALDADVYFGLSILKRTQFVASMVKLPESFSKEAVIAELKNNLTLPDGRNTEETQKSVNFIIADFDNVPDFPTVQEWLDEALVRLGEMKKNCLANKQRMEKSAQASVQIQSGEQSVALESIPALEAEIATINTAIQTLTESRGKLRGDRDVAVAKLKEKFAKEYQSKAPAIEAELAGLAAKRKEAKAVFDLGVSKLNLADKEFVSKVPALEKELQAARDAVTAAISAHQLALAKLESAPRPVYESNRGTVEAEKAKVLVSHAGLSGMVKSLNAEIEAVTKDISGLANMPCCAVCHNTDPKWKEYAVAYWQEQLAAKVSNLNDAKKSLEGASSRLVELNEALAKDIADEKEFYKQHLEQTVGAANKEFDVRHDVLVKERVRLEEAVTTTTAAEKAERDAALDAGTAELQTVLTAANVVLDKRKMELEQQMDSATADQQAAYEKQVDAEVVKMEEGIQEASNRISSQIVSKEVERGTINFRIKSAIEATTKAARKAKEEQERVKAVDDYDLHVIALDTLKEFQGKMVEQAFVKLLAAANRVADAVLKSPLQYRDGELGRVDEENRWIASRCFSGTEQAALYAAMSYALAKDAGFSIVRVDELGRLDPVNKKRFIERMVQLVEAGDISQFLGVDVPPAPPMTKEQMKKFFEQHALTDNEAVWANSLLNRFKPEDYTSSPYVQTEGVTVIPI